MTKRSVVSVIVLTLITFGIYALIWFIKTKREMVKAGAEIPTSWLLILPFVNIFWLWKWSGGVDHVTRGKSTQVINFILVFVLGIIGMAIVQSALNSVIDIGSSDLVPQPSVS
jgi:hypothetical protein